MDNIINIYSLNTNGLRYSIKRKATLNKLLTLEPGIFLLQETHSTIEDEKTWASQWGNKNIIFSHGSSNSKEVAVLISRKCEHTIS